MVQKKTNIVRKNHLNLIFYVSKIYKSIFGTPKSARRIDKNTRQNILQISVEQWSGQSNY